MPLEQLVLQENQVPLEPQAKGTQELQAVLVALAALVPQEELVPLVQLVLQVRISSTSVHIFTVVITNNITNNT